MRGFSSGEANIKSKLKKHEVLNMRLDWDKQYKSEMEVADRMRILNKLSVQYGAATSTIRDIVSNRRWKSVTLCDNPLPKYDRSEIVQANRKFSKQCLIEAAVCIAKKKGIWKVTKNELEEEARANLYCYFKNLDELLRTVEFEVYSEYKDEG